MQYTANLSTLVEGSLIQLLCFSFLTTTRPSEMPAAHVAISYVALGYETGEDDERERTVSCNNW